MVSATLVKCSAPAMPEPVTVPLAVLDGTGQPLPGAELHFEYFHCDARECHIGDLVPLDKPLFGEEEQKDSPHELGQEDGGKDTPQAASPGEEEGRGPADGVADEQEDEEREHTKDPEPEGLARASANVKEETSEDIVESIVEIVAMEEEKERGGYFAAACLGFVVLYGMRLLSAGLGYGSATCIQVGARDSDSKTSLPKVSSTGRSIDAKHLDLGWAP